jgi:hypothetical protein
MHVCTPQFMEELDTLLCSTAKLTDEPGTNSLKPIWKEIQDCKDANLSKSTPQRRANLAERLTIAPLEHTVPAATDSMIARPKLQRPNRAPSFEHTNAPFVEHG